MPCRVPSVVPPPLCRGLLDVARMLERNRWKFIDTVARCCQIWVIASDDGGLARQCKQREQLAPSKFEPAQDDRNTLRRGPNHWRLRPAAPRRRDRPRSPVCRGL